MVDLLGIDKLASSMALSMAVQAAGILLGPTISGMDHSIFYVSPCCFQCM